MGAHVSAVPNHQTGRVTPIGFRAAVAMFGAFGYELDPTALTADEQAEVRRQVAFYVERRDLFQRGRFLRLRSPFEGDGNETAWMVASETGDRAVVGFYRVLVAPAATAQPPRPPRARPGGDLRGHGLDVVRRAGRVVRPRRRRADAPRAPARAARPASGRPRRSRTGSGSSAATSSSACSTCVRV